jgi:hypothetical protein
LEDFRGDEEMDKKNYQRTINKFKKKKYFELKEIQQKIVEQINNPKNSKDQTNYKKNYKNRLCY